MSTSNGQKLAKRPIPVEVERLEGRFLLAGTDLAPFGFASEQLVSGVRQACVVVSSVSVTDQDPGPTLTGATSQAQGGRVDSYLLAAGAGEPAIQVQIQWGNGSASAEGTLLVLDAAGTPLYEFPLDGVAQLDALLEIPAAPGIAASGFALKLDLAIQRGDGTVANPGSYQLSLGWQATQMLAMPPANVGSGGLLPPLAVGVMPSSTPTPTLAITKALPTASLPANATGTPVGDPMGSTPILSTGGSTPPSSGGSPTTPIPPIVAASPPGANPAPSLALPTVAATPGAGRSLPIPLTESLGPGSSSAAGDRGVATYVGPLPLGPSIPDGGIFEYSFTATAPVPTGNPLTSETPVAVQFLGCPAVSTVIDPTPRSEQVVMPSEAVHRFAPSLRRSLRARASVRRSDDEPAAEGLAFLPPVPTTVWETRPAIEATGMPPQQPLGRPRGWINPVALALIALSSSAVTVFELSQLNRLKHGKS